MSHKRFIIPALALALALCACATAAETPTEASPQPVVVVTAAPDYLEIPADALPAATPSLAGGTVCEKLNVMLPVLDSLVRTMGIEGETSYAPHDAAFVWSYLYLMGENYGGTHPLVTVAGDAVIVPKAAMEAFAGAAFADDAGLPEQPEHSREIAVYDAGTDAYRLAPSDMGDTEVTLERWYALSNGTILAVAGLYNVDERLGALRFTLADNADGASVYPYTVQDACRNTGDGPLFAPLSMTEENASDLDGDGAEDVIAFEMGGEDRVTMRARLSNGRVFTETWDYFYNASAHVGDTQTGDGTRELYVCGDTGSDDYMTYVYRVEDGGLEKAELPGSVEDLTGDGTVAISTVVNVLGTYGGLCRYRLEHGAFSFALASDYAVCQKDWESRALTTKRDGLPVTDAATGAALTLPAGARLLLLGTDAKSYARLELSTGAQVLLPLRRTADSWEYLIGGVPESDWFTELLYAG